MEYQVIIDQLAEILQYSLPIAILIGLIERVCGMVVRAATGRGSE